MIIHVVKQGETIYSIAEYYDKSVERLILENGIDNPNNLVIGETLVILYPEIEHTVEDGDSLASIAESYNTTIIDLLRNNPYLSNRKNIFPGEVIVIKYRGDKIKQIATKGIVYPFVSMDTLIKTLPFLTYLTVYSYFYTNQGEILGNDDMEIIQTAKLYGVAPLMMLTTYSTSQAEEIEVIHNILANEEYQDSLINNIVLTLSRKGYYGVDFNTPYIKPDDRPLYVDFIRKLSSQLRARGYMFVISISLSVFELLLNIKYPDLQYSELGVLADSVIIISYEFGFSFGNVPTVASFDTIRNLVEYMVGHISSDKIDFGISTIGYIWSLPYIDGVTRGQSLSYDSVIDLAREVAAEIQYDDVTKASYFQFYSQNEYIVRFRDARGINAILSIVPTFDLDGVALWNVMFFYNQLWLVLNSQFEIVKINSTSSQENPTS
ncbi:MAG: LysM peptidoglycan-binding domain-containing protein [Bacillota bacterium]|nr:LysM peptidoglycan-binding domain-containing protein [Bacillota bacterium]